MAKYIDLEGFRYSSQELEKYITDSYLHLDGGIMKGAVGSSVVSSTQLEGNQGKAIINSTADAGSYTVLAKMNSTNGYFTEGTNEDKYVLYYTDRSLVDSGSDTVSKALTLLDESGNSQFPGTVTAPSFSGQLDGNASSATLADMATSDSLGQDISSTYIKSLAIGGQTITYIKGDNTPGTLITQDTKNTAGAIDTNSKLFLIGSTDQSANPQTYSQDTAYVGADGCLYSNDLKVSVEGHSHGLVHDNLTTVLENTTEDKGWAMLNSPYSGFLLKSIRTQTVAPNWIIGEYSSGIAFGGGDTKGVMSIKYNSPGVRFAGGAGTAPTWYFSLTGTNSKIYNLDSYLPITGGIITGDLGINGGLYLGADENSNGYLCINNKVVMYTQDNWLAINHPDSFTDGTYFNSAIVRTDGELQVGYEGVNLKVNGSTLSSNNPTTIFNTLNVIGVGATSPGFAVGTVDSTHLEVGYSTIATKSNLTTSAPLYINYDGGDVSIGGLTSVVKVRGSNFQMGDGACRMEYDAVNRCLNFVFA